MLRQKSGAVGCGEAKRPNGAGLPARVEILAFVIVAAVILLGTAATSFAAGVTTGKASYVVGDSVVITGQGWQPQEIVSLILSNTAGTRSASIQVVADADGNFKDQSYVVKDLDRDLLVTLVARGETGTETMVAFRAGVAPGTLRCAAAAVSNSNYGVSSGQPVSCSIEGATDLSSAQQSGLQPVVVVVKGGTFGNQPAEVTSVSGNTISFTWRPPSNGCGSTTVSYGPIQACNRTWGNCATLPLEGNDVGGAVAGFTIVDAYGNPTTCTVPPQLRVETSPKNGSFTAESQAGYSIVVSNPTAEGGRTASNVQLADQLPKNGGLVWESVTTTQGACTTPVVDNLLKCSLGDIPPQGAVTVTVKTPTATPAAACQSQPNLAAIASADGGVISQDTGALSCTPLAPGQLKVVVSPKNSFFTASGVATYIIYVTNPASVGSAPAKNVQLKDQLPGNGNLVWDTVMTNAGSCSVSLNLLTCSLGDIPAQSGATVVVQTPASTPLQACQDQPNPKVVVTADGGLVAEDSGFVTCTTLAPPQLKITKTPHEAYYAPGSRVSFSYVVSNPATAGAASANNVRLSDELPGNGGLTWSSVTMTQGGCMINNSDLNCGLGSIPAGGSATVTVSTPPTTPAQCTWQPSSAAKATADGGLTAVDTGGQSCIQYTCTGNPIVSALGIVGLGRLSIVSLGGDADHPNAGVVCSNGTVNGDIWVASKYGNFKNAAPCTETGTFYRGSKVTYSGPGKLKVWPPVERSEGEMNQLRDTIFAAAAYFAGLAKTESVQAQFPANGNIKGKLVVEGTPGINVVNLPGLTLNGNLVLTGAAGTQFVLNISGPFDLHSGSIVAGGGVGPYDVVYNITNPKASVKTMVPTTAFGILLAPYNSITPMDSAKFNGLIIGGYNQIIYLMSATRVDAPSDNGDQVCYPLVD